MLNKIKAASQLLFVAHVEVHAPNPEGNGWVLDYFEGEPCPKGYDSYEQLKTRLNEAGLDHDPAAVKLTRYDRGSTRYLFSF